jgi:Domain of unknown function (DUF4388)
MNPQSQRATSLNSQSGRGFETRLQGASLGDLIQMECLRGVRHVVCVSNGSQVGYLFFDQGQLVHATSGESYGEEAVYEMMGWDDGTFSTADRPWPLRATIHLGWQNLLIEALRRRDEGHRDSVTPSTLPEQSVPGASASAPQPKRPAPSRYGLLRAARVDEDGALLSTLGEDAEELVDVSSYSVRLSRLVGEALGAGAFMGLECRTRDRAVLVFPDGETTVALEADAAADLDVYRKRAGL